MVSVTQDQYDFWKDEAEKREISLPEFIRRAVTVYLSVVEKYNTRKSKLQETE